MEILIGPPHIANLTVSIMFGITTVQTYVYFGRCKQDGRLMRWLIMLLWILNVLHFILVSSTHYHYVIENFSNPAVLRGISKTATIIICITAPSDLIVRAIFISRIWKFSGYNITLLTVLGSGCLINFGSSIGFASRAFHLALFANYDHYSWLIYIALLSAAVTDVVIAISWCILLRRRSFDGMQRSKSVVRTLMIYSINTGALTSICAVCCLITYATMPEYFIYDAFYWALPTLYLNALLASLNARKKLRKTLEEPAFSLPVVNTSTVRFAPALPAPVVVSGWGNNTQRHESMPRILCHGPLGTLQFGRPLSVASILEAGRFLQSTADNIDWTDLSSTTHKTSRDTGLVQIQMDPSGLV